MSYSFQVRAESKAAVLLEVARKLDEVVAAQVCHVRDRSQAMAAATAFVELLTDDADRDVSVTMSGSLTGDWQGGDVTRVNGSNVSVSAYFMVRPAQAA